MPLLMTEDLLRDLVLYKKSHEKAVSTAARSLIVLFREVCPSLLVKKDRGPPTNPKAKPKAFGEVNVASDVPDVELLDHDDDGDSDGESTFSVGVSDDEGKSFTTDDEQNQSLVVGADSVSEEENDEIDEGQDCNNDDEEESDGDDEGEGEDMVDKGQSKARKRKFYDYDGQMNAADTSLQALKKLAGAHMDHVSSDLTDGFLSNEDFQRIKVLKAKKDAKPALTQHGLLKKGSDAKSAMFKIPSSEQLSIKPMDPAKLEINIRRKLNKEERLALVRAGREDRGKY